MIIEFVSVVARVRWGGQSRSAVRVVPSILYVTLGFLTHPTEMGQCLLEYDLRVTQSA